VFSFHPIKAITTGEGGMITTDDPALADRLRLLRFHGITRDAWGRYGKRATPDYEVVALGFKYNMTDLQAALGIVQLGRLDELVAARTALATWYADALRGMPDVEMLSAVPYPESARVAPARRARRDESATSSWRGSSRRTSGSASLQGAAPPSLLSRPARDRARGPAARDGGPRRVSSRFRSSPT
jgi:dTDP-4-amino-4,6-dideoxygalactose transaminase